MPDGTAAVRLGLQLVRGLSSEAGERMLEARGGAQFANVADLAERAKLGSKDLGALASAGALKELALNRHRARWYVDGVEQPIK
jgi:error-prone DNA polymerase